APDATTVAAAQPAMRRRIHVGRLRSQNERVFSARSMSAATLEKSPSSSGTAGASRSISRAARSHSSSFGSSSASSLRMGPFMEALIAAPDYARRARMFRRADSSEIPGEQLLEAPVCAVRPHADRPFARAHDRRHLGERALLEPM